jgi:hypothetical protein
MQSIIEINRSTKITFFSPLKSKIIHNVRLYYLYYACLCYDFAHFVMQLKFSRNSNHFGDAFTDSRRHITLLIGDK